MGKNQTGSVVDEVEAEAMRLLTRIQAARDAWEDELAGCGIAPGYGSSPDRAALERASLDLGRAMAKMRKTPKHLWFNRS